MIYLTSIIIICLTLIAVILIWFNLPGTFIYIFLTALFGFYFDFFNYKFFLLSLLVAIILEIIEFFLTAISVKIYGGKPSSSFLSIIGGIFGGILGTFIFPVFGSIVGLLIGAYLITYINEIKNGKEKLQALKISNSIILSYILSKSIKSIAVIFYSIYLIKSAF